MRLYCGSNSASFARAAKQSRLDDGLAIDWIASSLTHLAMTVLIFVLPHIKHKAGDDEHRRHRQRLRKHFRGRPLGGFLHAVLPRLGRESSLPAKACDSIYLYSEHPTTSIRFDLSPHSANIDHHKLE